MKEDIKFPKVENVGMSAVPDSLEPDATWRVYLVNLLDVKLSNVLISTRGYGLSNRKEVKTSELRHFFESVEPKSAVQVELIPADLRGLNNQYWLSYYLDGKLFDKKFIFLPDSLVHENLIDLPIVNKKGILIL